MAGTGLRISEALALRVNGKEDQTSCDSEDQVINVRSSICSGREIARLKTMAAKKTVDVDPQLNDLIVQFVDGCKVHSGDYLFQSRSGGPMHVNTARNRSAARGIPGFHSFRRFFISRRRSVRFPEFLLRATVGHSSKSITDEYDKSVEDEAYRKERVAKAGLGFTLPEL